ncbi:negative transcriptional regulator, partial [Aureobasidium melanogenum]
MYLRAVHAEPSIPALKAFLSANPLGLLTTALRSSDPSIHYLQTSHIPWVIDDPNPSDSSLPTLRGHIARQNPHAKVFIEHASASSTSSPFQLQQEVMVLFNAPHHSYVTPKFYTKTKPESGKVVPTWNYAAAQVYGTATVYVDSKADSTIEFLDKQIRDLSKKAEEEIMGHQKPWQVDDAPEKYIELLRKNIIGIEIKVTSLGGKYKMSQEMGVEDREGVAKGFEDMKTEAGCWIAKTVRERGQTK